MEKPVVVILGKIPPPYMGPSLATQIILKSSLNEHFRLVHVDTRAVKSLAAMGKFSIGKIGRNFSIYTRLWRTLRTERSELVLIPISQSTIGFLKDAVFILIALLHRRKVLIHLRGSNFLNWINGSSSLTRSFVRGLLRRTDGVIVLGQNLRYLFHGIYPEDRIYVVPNGADYSLRLQPKSNHPVRLLYLANLQASKGIEDLLEAVKRLTESGQQDFRLDVVGGWRSPETRQACEELVSRNRLPVFFHPPDAGEQKFRFLSEADIFIFPPRAPEGHPWVVVEAMAAGLPVISTDQGAIVESVHDGKNGFIVPVRDPAAIAERLGLLINDPLKRTQMGEYSRHLYETEFTEKRMVERLTAVFRDLIAAK
jgi:glycosyltransferase involved in cell wall biosynthesis